MPGAANIVYLTVTHLIELVDLFPTMLGRPGPGRPPPAINCARP